jgi:hypothetical protein
MRNRGDIVRRLAVIIGVYAVILAGSVRLHWAGDEPYYRPTAGLLVTFSLVAALVGLVSIWASFAAVHWSARASGLIVGIAVLTGFTTLFFEYSSFLIWQLLVLVVAQFAGLVAALSILRLCGYAIARGSTDSVKLRTAAPRRSQFAIRDLLLLTAAFASLLSVVHYTRPVEMQWALYAILISGGMCAALVSLATLWACVSTHHFALRITALLAVAPVGGVMWAVADHYMPLIMNAPWYSAVTTLQVVLMSLPLAVIRSNGYRFVTSATNERCEPCD